MVVGVEASVTKYVAEVQKVVQSSGLKSHMHSYGTTIGTLDFFPSLYVLLVTELFCFWVSDNVILDAVASVPGANSVEGPWDQGMRLTGIWD